MVIISGVPIFRIFTVFWWFHCTQPHLHITEIQLNGMKTQFYSSVKLEEHEISNSIKKDSSRKIFLDHISSGLE